MYLSVNSHFKAKKMQKMHVDVMSFTRCQYVADKATKVQYCCCLALRA